MIWFPQMCKKLHSSSLSRWLPAALVLWWLTIRQFRKSILTWWWPSENGLKLNVATCTVLHLLPHNRGSAPQWCRASSLLGEGGGRVRACREPAEGSIQIKVVCQSQSSLNSCNSFSRLFYYCYLEYGSSRPNSKKDVQRMQIVQNAVIIIYWVSSHSYWIMWLVIYIKMLVTIVKFNWNNDHWQNPRLSTLCCDTYYVLLVGPFVFVVYFLRSYLREIQIMKKIRISLFSLKWFSHLSSMDCRNFLWGARKSSCMKT